MDFKDDLVHHLPIQTRKVAVERPIHVTQRIHYKVRARTEDFKGCQSPFHWFLIFNEME